MQGLAGVDPAEFRAAGQEPLLKLEIWVVDEWINLCDLGGKNYVQDISISLGGAGMTPHPVEGIWSATIFNKDGVFHPKHPTSGYDDYLRTERLTRISIGAIYGGVPKYWPRIIGFMNEPKFNASDSSVIISGGDYMKRLEETEIKFPDNYWGAPAGPELFDSIASDGIIPGELYLETDAMDTRDDGDGAYNVVIPPWEKLNCLFVPFHDAGDGAAPSHYVGRVTNQEPRPVRITNLNVCAGVAGNSYRVKFWHRIVFGDGSIPIRVNMRQDIGTCFREVYYPTDTWKEETFAFTARDNTPIQWRFQFHYTDCDIRLDDFSITSYKFYYDRHYNITDVNEKGPFRVTLDTGGGAGFEDVWQAEEDEGWWYQESGGLVFFDINKVVASRANSVRIYYFMATPIEKILADLLFQAGVPDVNGDLYADAAAVLTAVEAAPGYIDPAIDINKAWFEPGTKCLDAVKKICERCNYRFYFRYDGTPIFRPKPGAHAADFELTDPKHAETIETYQSKSEIRNRIVIEGLKQTSHINREETVSSQYKGELADGGSIGLYGERTLTIKNHLFQDQDSILNAAGNAGMCFDLLAEYEDPKWYADLKIPFNPVPLEFGDNLQWEERLSPTLNIIPSPEGIIRDIKIDNYNTTYKCEKK